jgi:hypothetical protein
VRYASGPRNVVTPLVETTRGCTCTTRRRRTS